MPDEHKPAPPGFDEEFQPEAEADRVEDDSADQDGADELAREVDRLRDALLRTRAEMDNMEKRAQRDLERSRLYQTEALMRDLLPAIDGLEQGLENAAEDDASREGLALTHRLLFKALESHGLEVLDPIGERFDPQWHEAMSIQPSDEQAPDTVLAVFQKGYRLNNRLLRAARVIVVASN